MKKKIYSIKIITVGNISVGKTRINFSFVNGNINEEYRNTIGIDFLSSNIEYKDKIFKLVLLDTSGMEQFRSIARGYYKNCSFAIIVYDITDKSSFDSVKKWVKDCQNYGNENMHFVLVGNKIDLENERKVSTEEGQNLANEYNMDFLETSAKTGENIENIFQKICKIVNNNIDEGKYDFNDPTCGISISENEEEITINKTLYKINLANENNINRNNEDGNKCCK